MDDWITGEDPLDTWDRGARAYMPGWERYATRTGFLAIGILIGAAFAAMIL